MADPTTTHFALPYPILGDSPAGPAQIQALATTIDTALFTLSADHSCRVYRSSGDGAASIGTGVDVTVNFPTVKFDTDSFHTANDRITIPTGLGGKYVVGGGVRFQADAGGNRRTIHIDVNGSGNPIVMQSAPANGSVDARISVSTVIDLAATNYIQLHAYQDSGNALNGVIDNPAFPCLWAYRIPFL